MAATDDQDTQVEIKVRDNGPYKVTGPVRLIDPQGGVFEVAEGETIVLCRCGLSEDKPFCDSSHRGRFDSCVRAKQGSPDRGGNESSG